MLKILYQDPAIVVCEKPFRVLSTDEPGGMPNLIRQALGQPEAEVRTVHRLDRGTSGLMAVAKHAHAHERLKEQLHSSAFRRIYLAVCDGGPQPPSGVVDAPLGPREGSLVEQMVRPDGKPARTRYGVVLEREGRSLLRLALDTGRTHQIRVHMASIGHPLLGDTVYGSKKPWPGLAGQCLHAPRLKFVHPTTGKLVELECPLPDWFQHVLRQIDR